MAGKLRNLTLLIRQKNCESSTIMSKLICVKEKDND